MPIVITDFESETPTLPDPPVSSVLNDNLLGFVVSDDVDAGSHCEVTFGPGPDGSLPNPVTGTLDFGQELALRFHDSVIFDGRISAVEASFPGDAAPSMLVVVEDRLRDFRTTSRTRTMRDMSVSAVLYRLAADHGLAPEIDVADRTMKVVAQLEESDLSLACRLSRAVGADLWVEGRTLHAKARERRHAGSVALWRGNTLYDVHVRADLAEQSTKVVVAGWDVAGKQAIREQATDGAIADELNGRTSGAQTLERAFGERTRTIVDSQPRSSDEARFHAEVAFASSARRFVTARAVAEGNPALRVGCHVTLQGMAMRYDGEYYVTRVVHRFDRTTGYRTELTAERAWLADAD